MLQSSKSHSRPNDAAMIKPVRRVVTLLRIVQFPPDCVFIDKVDPKDVFNPLGSNGLSAMSSEEKKPHPLMHRTNTIDFIIILSGYCFAAAILNGARPLPARAGS